MGPQQVGGIERFFSMALLYSVGFFGKDRP